MPRPLSACTAVMAGRRMRRPYAALATAPAGRRRCYEFGGCRGGACLACFLLGQKIGGVQGTKTGRSVRPVSHHHSTSSGRRRAKQPVCAPDLGDGLRVAFKERRAAPILIWRYLTETAGG